MNELQSTADSGDRNEVPTEQESSVLFDLASKLRHQLVHDLGTAERPQLRRTRLGPTLAPPGAGDRSGLRAGANAAGSALSERTERERQAWQDHQRRQEFEHQLIDRNTVWLLTSQTLLFTAYGLTLQGVLGADEVRSVIRALGIAISATTWISVLAVINSKRLSWKDYQRYFEDGRPEFVPESAWADTSCDGGLQWGVRTANTWVALAPDALLPLVFITAWVFMP